MLTKKEQVIKALRAFINQRSGIEFGNYGDVKAFRSEQRSIHRDLLDARQLLRDVELRDSISADEIIKASRHAYSGRLSIVERDDGAIGVDYCAGQYFPTQYRKAVAAVCASVLWDYMRNNMPEPMYECGDGVTCKTKEEALKYVANPALTAVLAIEERYNGLSAGSWIRNKFKREFGARMQKRWFD